MEQFETAWRSKGQPKHVTGNWTSSIHASCRFNKLYSRWQLKGIFLGKAPHAKADSWGLKIKGRVSSHTEGITLQKDTRASEWPSHQPPSEAPCWDGWGPQSSLKLPELHIRHTEWRYSPALKEPTDLLGKQDPQTSSNCNQGVENKCSTASARTKSYGQPVIRDKKKARMLVRKDLSMQRRWSGKNLWECLARCFSKCPPAAFLLYSIWVSPKTSCEIAALNKG